MNGRVRRAPVYRPSSPVNHPSARAFRRGSAVTTSTTAATDRTKLTAVRPPVLLVLSTLYSAATHFSHLSKNVGLGTL